MSRKSERLVNLTIALLHSPRYLTKSEIFAKVAGYEGSAEAKERMFERDKDELRSIGIEIDVSQIDPLFQDEAGYRIFPTRYSIQVDGLDLSDIALMALGVRLLKTDNRELLLRLKALGAESGSDTPLAPIDLPDLAPLISAIDERTAIAFEYVNSEGIAQNRSVEPYAIYARSQRWFLVGFDKEKSEFRTFRLDRISGGFTPIKASAFVRDEAFSLDSFLHAKPTSAAVIRARKGTSWELRGLAEAIEEGEEWDLLTVPFFSREWILDKVLWQGDCAIVESPEELRNEAMAALEEVVRVHE